MPRDQSRRAGAAHDVKGMICGLNAEARKAVICSALTLAHNAAAIVVAQYRCGFRVGLYHAIRVCTSLCGYAHKSARISGSRCIAAEGIGYGIICSLRDAAHFHSRIRILRGIRCRGSISGTSHHLRPVQGAIAKGHAGPACPNKAAGVSVIRRARRFF